METIKDHKLKDLNDKAIPDKYKAELAKKKIIINAWSLILLIYIYINFIINTTSSKEFKMND